MKKIFIAFLFQSVFLFSFSTDEFINNLGSNKDELLKNGFIYSFSYNNSGTRNLKFTPDLVYKDEILERISKRGQTAIGEFIFYNKKKAKNNSSNLLKIYNDLNAISKFVEADFYNKTKKIERQLFLQAYRIESKDDDLELKDLKFNKIPSSNEQFVLLYPLPFNIVKFKVSHLYNDNDSIYMKATSINDLKYTIKLVNEDKLLIDIIIFEDTKGIILYGVQSARVNTFLGIKPPNNMINLLDFRFEGLFKWVVNKYLRD